MQIVSQIFFDQVHQRFDLFGFECRRFAAIQHVHYTARAQRREVMPVLQFGVDPVRNGWQDLLHRPRRRPSAQGRGNQIPDNLGVKGVAGESDTAIAEQIRGSSASFADVGADVQQGEVTGPTAEVSDQNQLVMISVDS